MSDGDSLDDVRGTGHARAVLALVRGAVAAGEAARRPLGDDDSHILALAWAAVDEALTASPNSAMHDEALRVAAAGLHAVEEVMIARQALAPDWRAIAGELAGAVRSLDGDRVRAALDRYAEASR